MDYRQHAFKDKFADAATLLDAAPEQLASLKIRDNVTGYDEYHELLHALEHEEGIRSRNAQGNFQGNGHLVEQSKTKVIIVEDETGLEVLYIAGSIASLLGLIPLILRCWSVVRGDGRHRTPDFRHVEIRRLGADGRLVEERNIGLDVPWAARLSVMNTVLMSAAETIDTEIQRLRSTVLNTAKRVDLLEETVAAGTVTNRKTNPKRKANEQRKRQ